MSTSCAQIVPTLYQAKARTRTNRRFAVIESRCGLTVCISAAGLARRERASVPRGRRQQMLVRGRLGVEKFVKCHADVSRNLPEEQRRDVASRVKRYGGRPPVRMPELLVRSSLPYLDEPEASQASHHLSRFQDRGTRHD